MPETDDIVDTEPTEEREDEQPMLLTADPPPSRLQKVALDAIALDAQAAKDTVLAPSLRAVGLLHPVLLLENGDRYTIVAGKRRIAAAKSLHAEGEWPDTIEARVFVGASKIEQASILLRENANRSDNPIAELKAIKQCLSSGLEVKQIAKALNVSTAWVDRRLSLDVLPETIKRSVARKQTTIGTALRVAKLPAKQREKIAREASEDGGRVSMATAQAATARPPVDNARLFERPAFGLTINSTRRVIRELFPRLEEVEDQNTRTLVKRLLDKAHDALRDAASTLGVNIHEEA